MKNIKTLFTLTIFSVILLTLTSCQDPIFYGILHDVAPEKATVSGNIISIARGRIDGTEYLFCSGNGSLLYKELSSSKHGEWKNYTKLPFDLHYYDYLSNQEGHKGQQIWKVAADENNLYVLTASFTTDTEDGLVIPKNFYLWTRQLNGFLQGTREDWTNIAEKTQGFTFPTRQNKEESSFETFFNLFFTNSPIPEHRKAYLRTTDPSTKADTYYLLNGSNALSADASIGSVNYLATDSEKKNTRVNSAFYIGDSLYFTDAQVVCTNETSQANATYACLASVDKKYNSSKELYLYKGNSASESERYTKVMTMGSTIASLALTKNSIIVGEGSYTSSYTSNGGIERIELDAEGKPAEKISSFTNNASYQFTAAYILMTLLCTDPSKTEEEATLYTTITYRGSGNSASASPANIGLWSYYPDRGNWNRE